VWRLGEFFHLHLHLLSEGKINRREYGHKANMFSCQLHEIHLSSCRWKHRLADSLLWRCFVRVRHLEANKLFRLKVLHYQSKTKVGLPRNWTSVRLSVLIYTYRHTSIQNSSYGKTSFFFFFFASGRHRFPKSFLEVPASNGGQGTNCPK
jgi:hypothetical protein